MNLNVSDNGKNEGDWIIRYMSHYYYYDDAEEMMKVLVQHFQGRHVTIYAPNLPALFISVLDTGEPVFSYDHEGVKEKKVEEGEPLTLDCLTQ